MIQLIIEALFIKQLLVAALLNDVAVAHNEDDIALFDSGEPVSDYKACSA